MGYSSKLVSLLLQSKFLFSQGGLGRRLVLCLCEILVFLPQSEVTVSLTIAELCEISLFLGETSLKVSWALSSAFQVSQKIITVLQHCTGSLPEQWEDHSHTKRTPGELELTAHWLFQYSFGMLGVATEEDCY